MIPDRQFSCYRRRSQKDCPLGLLWGASFAVIGVGPRTVPAGATLGKSLKQSPLRALNARQGARQDPGAGTAK